jgi:hypothetical protein
MSDFLNAVPIVGGAASTILSALQAGNASQPINYGKQYAKVMQAQLAYAPKVLQAHQQYDPAYAQLDEQLMWQRLFGAPGGKQEQQYLAGYKQVPMIDKGTGRITGYQSVPVYGSHTIDTPGTRGMIDIYGNDIAPALAKISAADDRTRAQGDIDTLAALGPAAKAAFDQANPEAAALLARLTGEATTDLAAGTALNPDQARQVTQSYRRATAARGTIGSPAAAFLEALKTSSAGQALQANRRQQAANVVGMNQSFYGDPYQRLFGRSSGATPSGANFLNAGASGTRLTVNDPSAAATSLASTQFGGDANAANFWRQQMAGAGGATLGAIGQWLGSTGQADLPTNKFSAF